MKHKAKNSECIFIQTIVHQFEIKPNRMAQQLNPFLKTNYELLNHFQKNIRHISAIYRVTWTR